jgi:hypothetical protein
MPLSFLLSSLYALVEHFIIFSALFSLVLSAIRLSSSFSSFSLAELISLI